LLEPPPPPGPPKPPSSNPAVLPAANLAAAREPLPPPASAACCTTTFSRVFQALQDLHWPDLQDRGRLWVRSAFQQWAARWVAAGGGGGSGVPTPPPRSPLCRLLSASAAHVELFGLRAGAGSAGQHQAAVSWWVGHL
jgi:hypothetical protein